MRLTLRRRPAPDPYADVRADTVALGKQIQRLTEERDKAVDRALRAERDVAELNHYISLSIAGWEKSADDHEAASLRVGQLMGQVAQLTEERNQLAQEAQIRALPDGHAAVRGGDLLMQATLARRDQQVAELSHASAARDYDGCPNPCCRGQVGRA